LSQETIFVETTNKDAATDGVRSILKPYVASRRFVIQRDDTGTYVQFGFGSDDDDVAGIADPSKIALKMHGKNFISTDSFDPTQLLSTNKLGISPYNTRLKIIYRTNTTAATKASTNSITNIRTFVTRFVDKLTLDPIEMNKVNASLECINENPINSISNDITAEELKLRAKAHYATQSRAVTKQDYESLCYNMPKKFGAIKRANILNLTNQNDFSPSRRMSLYVISEDNSGNLAPANSIIKNNLRNWLSHYKMLSDTIDIYDAKIVNFAVDFVVVTDNAYNSDTVLFECMKELRTYFSEVYYIGEPLYIPRIYDVLNDVDGVITVKKVNVKNKADGVYSNVYMDFDKALSRDGTYINTPKNVILEMKYPSDDIKGSAR